MSAKRTHSVKSDQADTPRPTAFFLAVLFAAGVSTWHWYRPLPKQAGQMVDGAAFASQTDPARREEFPKAKSKWKDAGLIFPSSEPEVALVDNATASPSNAPSEPQAPDSLTGSRDLALEPFRETARPLRDSMAQAPLPRVPVKDADSRQIPAPSQARLWNVVTPSAMSATPDPTATQLANRSPIATEPSPDAASPFRVPRVAGTRPSPQSVVSLKTDIWPDQGFDPNKQQSPRQDASQIATLAPATTDGSAGVMSLSSNRIRTLDQEPQHEMLENAKANVPSPKLRPIGPESAEDAQTPAPRRGSFIRQPPPKESVTK
ncbi:MAG: hypothetical protein ACK553_02555 [Planctomycetota bacterium]|jgi:hypothetical protein